jgi:hypothetical protein
MLTRTDLIVLIIDGLIAGVVTFRSHTFLSAWLVSSFPNPDSAAIYTITREHKSTALGRCNCATVKGPCSKCTLAANRSSLCVNLQILLVQ